MNPMLMGDRIILVVLFRICGGGLRQDSRGSIKQGNYRNIDPREVESRRINGQVFPAVDLTYECRSHHNPYDALMEMEHSSSHDQLFSVSWDPYDMQISAKLTENGAITLINPRSAKSVGYKPSGYLKVKGKIQNPAITAVKMQLGRHYHEGGPILGVAFDPLLVHLSSQAVIRSYSDKEDGGVREGRSHLAWHSFLEVHKSCRSSQIFHGRTI